MRDKNPEYYDNINLDMLNAIPQEARTILEIGCGAGRLGMEYKKRNPNCVYYGVEIIPAAAATAATRLDMVLCGSVDAVDLSFLTGAVDCIVYGDVIEHLVDPWAVLANHRTLLKDSGRMVACIPNIQHWTVVASLLHGYWTYQDNGLLDATHLRFFTLNSIIALFESVGLRIGSVVGRTLDPENTLAFFEKIKPALANLGVDEVSFRERSGFFQYIVHAVPR